MLRIECNPDRDLIIVEPFILWNDDTSHDGVALKDITANPVQKIAMSTYYYFKDGYDLNEQCKTHSRNVNIRIEQGILTVKEKTHNSAQTLQVDLFRDIGSAWAVYGPVYQAISNKVEKWEGCRGHEGSGLICQPISAQPEKPLKN